MERLLAALNAMDGDPDLEPWLGDGDDREVEDEHGGDINDEPHDADRMKPTERRRPVPRWGWRQPLSASRGEPARGIFNLSRLAAVQEADTAPPHNLHVCGEKVIFLHSSQCIINRIMCFGGSPIVSKVLTTTAALALSSTAVLAADLPLRTAPPPPPVAAPLFTWTGAYFGVNAGYAFDNSSRFRTFDDPAATAAAPAGFGAGGVSAGDRPGLARVNSDGFTGGGQIGYNYQFGAGSGVVVGIEADAAYTDLGQTNSYTLTSPTSGVTRLTTLHADMDFLGTVRGRVGYAFDRFMIYGTGGFAYGDVTERSRFFLANGTTLTYTGGRSNLRTGYTYGGGIEYALPTTSFINFFNSSAVTVKAEYLHYDLGTESLALPATGAGGIGNTGTYTQRIRTDGDLARVGLNYKF